MIWCCRETLNLRKMNKSRSKSEISFVPCERLSSLNTVWRMCFLLQRSFHFPLSRSSFLSIFEEKVFLQPKAKTVIKALSFLLSHSPEILLHKQLPVFFCAINCCLFWPLLSLPERLYPSVAKNGFHKAQHRQQLPHLLLNSCVHFFISVKPF